MRSIHSKKHVHEVLALLSSHGYRDTRISHVVLLFRVSFVSAVDNLWLQKKLHSIKQRPEENTTAYILRFLSEAKLAYPTANAMGEEGKVVSFLKGFTDRAFAGHLLRTVQAITPGTATEMALEKEAERKKEHQVMDEELIEVSAAQTNQESAYGFLSIFGNRGKTDESTPWSKQENAGSIVDHAHRCAKDGEPEPQPLPQQRTDGMS